MTDLTKGIIEINRFEIGPNTTLDDIKTKFDGTYANQAVSKSGNVAIFSFKNIYLINRNFDVDVTFVRGELSDIRMFAYQNTGASFEEFFKADCEWLKSLLGEPTKAGSNGVVYVFDAVQVGATLWESDGRTSPDEYIELSYQRGTKL